MKDLTSRSVIARGVFVVSRRNLRVTKEDHHLLSIVSQALRGFLQATAPPPAPEARPHDWVRIGDLSEDVARDNADCVILSMYLFEPDPYGASVESDRESPAQRPLALTMHYAVRYASRSHENCLRALGIVLRAFHSNPRIEISTYVTPEGFAASEADGAVAKSIVVEPETPDADVLGLLWTKARRTMPLAAYYRVRVALIPSWDRVPESSLTRVKPPAVGRMPSKRGAKA